MTKTIRLWLKSAAVRQEDEVAQAVSQRRIGRVPWTVVDLKDGLEKPGRKKWYGEGAQDEDRKEVPPHVEGGDKGDGDNSQR